jgi:hypothetical protein
MDNWIRKYPKYKKSIRIKQLKTLESKTFNTFPGMGGGTFVKHFSQLDLPLQVCVPRSQGVPKVFNKEPAHTNSFQVFVGFLREMR